MPGHLPWIFSPTTVAVLRLLATGKSRYGSELASETMPRGTVYQVVRRLVGEGLVAVHMTDRDRPAYRITDEGRRRLRAYDAAVRAYYDGRGPT